MTSHNAAPIVPLSECDVLFETLVDDFGRPADLTRTEEAALMAQVALRDSYACVDEVGLDFLPLWLAGFVHHPTRWGDAQVWFQATERLAHPENLRRGLEAAKALLTAMHRTYPVFYCLVRAGNAKAEKLVRFLGFRPLVSGISPATSPRVKTGDFWVFRRTQSPFEAHDARVALAGLGGNHDQSFS